MAQVACNLGSQEATRAGATGSASGACKHAPYLRFLALLLATGVVTPHNAATAAEPPAAAERFFETRIRPLLAARCYKCHSEKEQESGLRLDSRAAMLAGGDYGPSLDLKSPASSRLLTAISYQDEDLQMPPGGKLTDREIADLTAWVKAGAPWPKTTAAPPSSLSGPELFAYHRRTHWAYQPIGRPPLPAVKNAQWPAGAIDRFVLARLEEKQLAPSPPADRRTLLRRAKFDLVGLPPTAEEVAAFQTDTSPAAYVRLIDRLLASPRYGERWGRHWLDVARYADTKGYAFGQERRFPYAYTYRDYVIRSFNADLPYDQFVLEQLAADKLPPRAGNESLAGLGFLTVGRQYRNTHDTIDDQIDVVTRGLLGLTVACARCHDHKYDPIPTQDYYSLYGVFASSRRAESPPVLGNPGDSPQYKAFVRELAKRRQALEAFSNERRRAITDAARRRATDYLVRVLSKQPERLLEKLPFISLSREELKPKIVQRWRQYLVEQGGRQRPVFGPLLDLMRLPADDFARRAAPVLARWSKMPAGTAAGHLNPRIAAALRGAPPQTKIELAQRYGGALEKAYADWIAAGRPGYDSPAHRKLPPDLKQILHVLLGPDSPTIVPESDLRSYLTRANRNKQRALQKKIDEYEVSAPGAPPRPMSVEDSSQPRDARVFIRGSPGRRGEPAPRRFLGILSPPERPRFQEGSGRLELAQAIATEANPLTARVIANRVWMHHFGQPLVSTPSDFGARSSGPSHPELLDYLAWRLVDSGWSLKALHREIMLSATYRQQSLDRPAARGIDAENRLLWKMNRRRLEFEVLRDSLLWAAGRLDTRMYGRPVEMFSGKSSRRRSVYGFIDRQDLPGLLRVFDFAGPDQTVAQRPRTTVPQQALYLMNSPFAIEQARAVAERCSREQDRIEDFIRRLYLRVLAREPRESEIHTLGNLAWRLSMEGADAAGSLPPRVQIAHVVLMSNEFAYVD